MLTDAPPKKCGKAPQYLNSTLSFSISDLPSSFAYCVTSIVFVARFKEASLFGDKKDGYLS